jgi:hypothetical protein
MTGVDLRGLIASDELGKINSRISQNPLWILRNWKLRHKIGLFILLNVLSGLKMKLIKSSGQNHNGKQMLSD